MVAVNHGGNRHNGAVEVGRYSNGREELAGAAAVVASVGRNSRWHGGGAEGKSTQPVHRCYMAEGGIP